MERQITQSELNAVFQEFTEKTFTDKKNYHKLPYDQYVLLKQAIEYTGDIYFLLSLEVDNSKRIELLTIKIIKRDCLEKVVSMNVKVGECRSFAKMVVDAFDLRGGNKDMNILNKNKFNFGSCKNDAVKLSMYGIAVRNNEGVWVSYDKDKQKIMDVEGFLISDGELLYKMPVAVKDVSVGDMVIHQKKPYAVIEVSEEYEITAIDLCGGVESKIIPAENIFGFNFITKIISLIDFKSLTPDEENPFGNILPFLMMSNNEEGLNPMMLMLMGSSSGGMDFSNPLMLYALTQSPQKNDNLLPIMLMMNQKKNK